MTESAMLPDRSSGTPREVDILVQGKIGANLGVTIGIECRDHSRPAGQPWVDQVMGTHQNLSIDRTILVSRSGFTKPAKAKCDVLNVKAITFEEGCAPDWSRFVGRIRRAVLQVICMSAPSKVRVALREASAPNLPNSPENVLLLDNQDVAIGILGELVCDALHDEELRSRAERTAGANAELTTTIAIPLDPGAYLRDVNNRRFSVASIKAEAICKTQLAEADVQRAQYGDVAVAYGEFRRDMSFSFVVAEQEKKTPACSLRATNGTTDGKSSPEPGSLSPSPTKDLPRSIRMVVARMPTSAASDKKIVASPEVRKEWLRPFNIRFSDVRLTILEHDRAEILHISPPPPRSPGYEVSRINLYCKQLSAAEGLLVVCWAADSELRVQYAFRIPREVHGGESNPSPLELLERLADKLGVLLTVGESTAKFFFAERIPIGENGGTTLLAPSGAPYGHEIAGIAYVQMSSQGYADCALAFAIDLTLYRKALHIARPPRKKRKRRR